MAEWSNAAVLKTVDLNGSGGSNPSLSANKLKLSALRWAFFVQGRREPRSCKALRGKSPTTSHFLNFNRKRTCAVMSGFLTVLLHCLKLYV